jgi:hypothetical protein
MLVEISFCQVGTGAIAFSGNSFETQRPIIFIFRLCFFIVSEQFRRNIIVLMYVFVCGVFKRETFKRTCCSTCPSSGLLLK